MNFKNTICALLLAMTACIAGCKTSGNKTIYVIDNKNVVTNRIPQKAFNDERYVWEGFIFSTNQVKEAKK